MNGAYDYVFDEDADLEDIMRVVMMMSRLMSIAIILITNAMQTA